MVINSDSWHYKLISMMNRRYEGNLCSYMRALVASLCMLLLLGALLGEVILVIVLIPGIAILDFFNVPYYLGILSFLAPPRFLDAGYSVPCIAWNTREWTRSSLELFLNWSWRP